MALANEELERVWSGFRKIVRRQGRAAAPPCRIRNVPGYGFI
jgi:hypothetical protein